ncbi:phasin [Lichenibacterium ramalinae]|uniref:Phasin n=1 Tax=Lichenibacterium ramalinae TaxID=2316527 RepID=A0A4Q2R8U6_9HYPH|nr:phasin [Lichenibacterium ramalinae]RYB03195.1 phasin [Lichenibacterium ramalinae]
MPTPSYEIPADMRDMAEKSVDQARRAFDGFINAAQKAAGQADTTAASVQSNAKTIGSKAMGFAEVNVRSAFDLAQKLVRAKDLQEVLALQTDYAKSQMTTIQEQAKELGSIVQTTAQGVVQSASASVKTATDNAMNQNQS